jgi:hypothetical protein
MIGSAEEKLEREKKNLNLEDIIHYL